MGKEYFPLTRPTADAGTNNSTCVGAPGVTGQKWQKRPKFVRRLGEGQGGRGD